MLQYNVSPIKQDASHNTPLSLSARAAIFASVRFPWHFAHSLSNSIDDALGVAVGKAVQSGGHGLQSSHIPQNLHTWPCNTILSKNHGSNRAAWLLLPRALSIFLQLKLVRVKNTTIVGFVNDLTLRCGMGNCPSFWELLHVGCRALFCLRQPNDWRRSYSSISQLLCWRVRWWERNETNLYMRTQVDHFTQTIVEWQRILFLKTVPHARATLARLFT